MEALVQQGCMTSSDVVFEKGDTDNFKFIPIGNSESDKDSEAALKAVKTFADLAVCIDWKTSFPAYTLQVMLPVSYRGVKVR